MGIDQILTILNRQSFKIKLLNINDSSIANFNVSINIVINHIFLWDHNYHQY